MMRRAVVRGGRLSLLLPQPAVRERQLHPPAAGLVPYSPYRTELHLLAVQMYAWATRPTGGQARPSAWPADGLAVGQRLGL